MVHNDKWDTGDPITLIKRWADYARTPENTIRLHNWMIVLALLSFLLYFAPFYWDCHISDTGVIENHGPVLGVETIMAIFLFILTPALIYFALNPYKQFEGVSGKRLAWLTGSILALTHMDAPFIMLFLKSYTNRLAEDLFTPAKFEAQAATAPYMIVNWMVVIPVFILGFLLMLVIWIANSPELHWGGEQMKKKKAGLIKGNIDNPWKVIYSETFPLFKEYVSEQNSPIPSEMEPPKVPATKEYIDENALCPHCIYEFTARYSGEPYSVVKINCPRCQRDFQARVRYDLSLQPVA
jgi:hypothetical protein